MSAMDRQPGRESRYSYVPSERPARPGSRQPCRRLRKSRERRVRLRLVPVRDAGVVVFEVVGMAVLDREAERPLESNWILQVPAVHRRAAAVIGRFDQVKAGVRTAVRRAWRRSAAKDLLG